MPFDENAGNSVKFVQTDTFKIAENQEEFATIWGRKGTINVPIPSTAIEGMNYNRPTPYIETPLVLTPEAIELLIQGYPLILQTLGNQIQPFRLYVGELNELDPNDDITVRAVATLRIAFGSESG